MKADHQDVNPYASPREITHGEPIVLTINDAIDMIQRPAASLRILGCLSFVIGFFVILHALLVDGKAQPRRDAGATETSLFILALVFLLLIKPATVALSAHKILHRHYYPWIWVGIVVGLIPFGTRCAIIEVIVAFWLLHVVMKSGVRSTLAGYQFSEPTSSL